MKKFFILFVTLILCLSFSIPVYAEEYGNDYPSYVNISGGAYIETQSSIGTVTLVFQNQYKSGYFGFIGRSGYNVCNVYGGQISGYVYTPAGQTYSCRATYGSAIEYRDNYYPYDYHDLNITKILNTNIEFIDFSGERSNTIVDFSPFQIITTILLLFILFLNIHKHTKIG